MERSASRRFRARTVKLNSCTLPGAVAASQFVLLLFLGSCLRAVRAIGVMLVFLTFPFDFA